MELFQLRYFEAVVSQGSLTAAAELCHVSQPSLSAQVKSLENELGVRLLNRTSRGVSPTKAGERLLVSARRILAEAGEVRHDLRHRRYGDEPILRIAAQPFLACETLPKALALFLKGANAPEVQVKERPLGAILEAVLAEEVDLGLITLPPTLPDGLERRPLFTSPYAVYCRFDHPLVEKGPVLLRDLLAHPLLLFNEAVGFAERISVLAEQENAHARIVFTSDQAPTVLEMAAEGAGVAVLPALLADRGSKRNVCALPLQDHSLQISVGAIWRKTAAPFEGIESLLQHIAELNCNRIPREPDTPGSLEHFVAQYIESIDQLEVLILLAREKSKSWSAEQVNERIQSNPTSAGKNLADLCAAGLLRADDTVAGAYRYQPRSTSLDEFATSLTALYNQRRATVVEMIHSKSSQKVRGFADAFKLRRDRDV